MNSNQTPQQLRLLGGIFLGCGIAFMAIAISGQRIFFSVGIAFIAIGAAFLGRAHSARDI